MRVFLKKHWRKFVLAGITLPIMGYFALCFIIGAGVKGAVSSAQSRFPGDPVTALIEVATSEEAKLSDRNRAIWALGQLGNSRAMPTLQSLRTGEPCDHERLICQREVESAIKGCDGSCNIGAVVWRRGDLAVASRE